MHDYLKLTLQTPLTQMGLPGGQEQVLGQVK